MPHEQTRSYQPDDKHRVKRIAYRAAYDAPTIHAILDSAYICHIAFVDEGCQQIIPMTYWRDGEFIYFHAAARARFARACSTSAIALSVTLMDGLVLGHSPINHSANYRSVVVHGHPQIINARNEKLLAMQSFFAKTLPGRWEELRHVRDDEIDAMTVFRLQLDQVSAKIRNEFPDDEEHMPTTPVWVGILPVRPIFDSPVADPRFPTQPTPTYLEGFTGKADFLARIDRL